MYIIDSVKSEQKKVELILPLMASKNKLSFHHSENHDIYILNKKYL